MPDELLNFRFQNLHEFVKVARQNLDRNNWDYLIGGSETDPGMDKAAEAAGDGFRIFQLYVRGDEAWLDDHVRRAADRGYNAFCLTIDTDSYSRRERDIAKRHQRRRVRVDDARIY